MSCTGWTIPPTIMACFGWSSTTDTLPEAMVQWYPVPLIPCCRRHNAQWRELWAAVVGDNDMTHCDSNDTLNDTTHCDWMTHSMTWHTVLNATLHIVRWNTIAWPVFEWPRTVSRQWPNDNNCQLLPRRSIKSAQHFKLLHAERLQSRTVILIKNGKLDQLYDRFYITRRCNY